MEVKKVLVLEAHVDDAFCGCGGTIRKHLERGDTVQWHTFIGNGYSVPENWAPNSLGAEHKKAMDVLGVTDYYLYDYNLGILDMTSGLRNLIFKIWHDFDPDIAYVPWRKSRHQDHRTVGDFACQVSWRTSADVLAYTVLNDFSGFNPTVFSSIDENTWSIKLKALEQFKSQFILRSWFTSDLTKTFMQDYAVFINNNAYVEPFEQIKRVIKL